MYLISIWLLSVLHLFNHFAAFAADLDNLMIETIDITVEYQENNRAYHIEAFRSTNNDKIIETNKTDQYGRLEWHSIGSPLLSNISSSKNSSLSFANLFEITPSGFSVFIEFLNDAQKRAIIEKIKSKYGIDVNTSQIYQLKFSEITCLIDIVCETNEEEWIKLRGSTKIFTKFPLEVKFKDQDKSKLTCLHQYLVEHQHIDLECTASRNSKNVKKNYFSISADQINSNEITDKLFGDGDEKLVSREQLANLANEIYTSFHVYAEYEIPKDEFSSKFIEGLIKQTNAAFKPVPFKEAISSLSKYSMKDLEPNQIKSAFEKALKVKTEGSKKHIVVDKESANSQSQKNNTSLGTSVETDLKVASLKMSCNFAKGRENSWANSNKSLDNQLKELNDHTRDQIEWKFDGNRIIPKSLKLAKIVKSTFKNGLKFEKIERFVSDKLQVKSFNIKYKDGKNY